VKVSVENGSFSYRKGRPVIQNLDFSAGSGDLVAILGPNGAGKTTLLRCITGFLRWSGGRSALDGRDIRSIPTRQFWRRVAYVPQARGVFSSLTAEEMVLLGRTNRIGVFSVPKPADLDRVRALMDKLRIGALAGRKCSELSGGELQMVLIARALAAEPELLILDEPESGLDFRNQLIVLDTMSRLAADGMCCVFNTHYPAHALARAPKSLLLSRGGGYLFGETGRVVTEENLEKAFGVKTAIGEVETPGKIYRDIIPLEITDPGGSLSGRKDGPPRAAAVTVICIGAASGGRVGALLREYRRYLTGLTEIPCRESGASVITAAFDAPPDEIVALSHRLGMLPGVSVKTTWAPQNRSESPA